MRHARRSLFLVVFVAVLLVQTAAVPRAASGARSRNLDVFAKCLAAKHATMYGSFWCRHCDDQKEMFGSSFQYIPYVECSTPGLRQMVFLCQAKGIRYTPTWIFADGERRVGLQSLQALSQKTACALP